MQRTGLHRHERHVCLLSSDNSLSVYLWAAFTSVSCEETNPTEELCIHTCREGWRCGQPERRWHPA